MPARLRVFSLNLLRRLTRYAILSAGFEITRENELLSQFGLIGILFVVAFIFPIVMLLLSYASSLVGIRPKAPNAVKSSTYECGMTPVGTSWLRFNFRYYFFALLFVVFDVETVFLYPWAVAYKQLPLFALAEMAVFIVILAVGLAYAWKKNVLEWK